MVSVCLPSDALLQHLPSYLGFSYLGRGVSLHSCSSKVQPLLLTLDKGYLLTAAVPDLQRGTAPLGHPMPVQPPLFRLLLPAAAPGLRRHLWPQAWGAPPGHCLLHSVCQQIWKTQQWPQDWKRSVSIPIPKKGKGKECSNYCTIALISHASKVMLKILQARVQQYVNRELPDVQAGFRKGGGTRDQIANICWIMEKAREFQKNIYFCFIDYAKAFDCVDHNKLWK